MLPACGGVLPDCGSLLRQHGRHSSIFVRRHTPRWLVVNELGAEILELCDGCRSLRDISALLSRKYASSPTGVERDVLSFWSTVEDAGFLTESPSQPKEPTGSAFGSPEIYVTTRCNQSCPHCGVRGAFPEGDMPAALFRRVVREAAALGAARVVITGGEPFLREDLFDLLLAAEPLISTQVLTNGALVDAAKARELAALGTAVQVSLDGGCAKVHDLLRGDGTFDAALRAIRLLCSAGVSRLTVNFTIQRANACEARGLLELAEREGVREVTFTSLAPGVSGERRFQCADADSILTLKEFLDHYTGPVLTAIRIPGFGRDAISLRRWCAPGHSPSIAPDGSVFPCTLFARTPFVIGKLPEEALEKVIASKTLLHLRRICRERVDKIEECSSCVWKHFCLAGCAAFSYHQRGTLLVKDSLCETRQRLYAGLFLGGESDGNCSEE
jgi:radical SAM protein with 4Fe4S-binding SPASM domain